MGSRWFRDVYRDAVWESEGLKGLEKAVAETYARHARDERGSRSESADLSWLTYERLMEKAGIGSRATVVGLVARLVAKGWLKPVQQVSRRATVYRLMIPLGSTESGTTEPEVGSAESDTTVVHLASYANSGSTESGTTVVPKVERNLKVLEDQKKPLSLGAQAQAAVPDATPRESLSTSSDPKPRTGSAYAALARFDVTGDEADQAIEWANDDDLGPGGGPKGFAWWKAMARSGDLADLVDDFRNAAPERRRREPCPEHGGDDPSYRRSRRSRGNCDECRDLYHVHDLYAQLPDLDPKDAGRYLECPEHPGYLWGGRGQHNDIGSCTECATAHGDAAYWMTHQPAEKPAEAQTSDGAHPTTHQGPDPANATADDPWRKAPTPSSDGMLDDWWNN